MKKYLTMILILTIFLIYTNICLANDTGPIWYDAVDTDMFSPNQVLSATQLDKVVNNIRMLAGAVTCWSDTEYYKEFPPATLGVKVAFGADTWFTASDGEDTTIIFKNSGFKNFQTSLYIVLVQCQTTSLAIETRITAQTTSSFTFIIQDPLLIGSADIYIRWIAIGK